MTALLGDTAEDSNHPLGLNALLSSRTKLAKPLLSDSGPLLQSTCQHLGYSQSKSNPSKFHFSMNCTTCEMNFALAVGLLTKREYLSPKESFHPPIAIKTFIPLARRAVTL